MGSTIAESPIRKTENDSELRLEWHNAEVRQDRLLFWFLFLFWCVWTPITLWATHRIFAFDNDLLERIGLSVWCIFGWFGTLGIPCQLLQRYGSEWISLSADRLVCGQRGWLARRPKSIPIASISTIWLGRMRGSCEPDSRESVVTLNVYYDTPKTRGMRQMVGYWLHPTLKEQVFCDMQDYVARRGIPVTFRRNGSG